MQQRTHPALSPAALETYRALTAPARARVARLVAHTSCSLEHAIAAVQAATKEETTMSGLTRPELSLADRIWYQVIERIDSPEDAPRLLAEAGLALTRPAAWPVIEGVLIDGAEADNFAAAARWVESSRLIVPITSVQQLAA